MPISPEANQMAQLQGQQMMDPQKLMMLLAALQQQAGTPAPQASQGQGLSAMLGGSPAMSGGQPSPQTLGINQPIPMQMPQSDPQGQQKQPPLPPDPMGMQ